MAKFTFKLESLLRQRKRDEQEAQRLLAVHAAVVNQLQESLRLLNADMQSNTDAVRSHLTGKLDMHFLAAHRRYTGSMQRKGMDLLQQIANAQKKVDEARVALTEAARNRKAMEKLREKQFDRWKADQARRETAAADEIGSQLGYENAVAEEEFNPIAMTMADNTNEMQS